MLNFEKKILYVFSNAKIRFSYKTGEGKVKYSLQNYIFLLSADHPVDFYLNNHTIKYTKYESIRDRSDNLVAKYSNTFYFTFNDVSFL